MLTAQEDASAFLEDPELLDRSTRLGRVLFARYKDLLSEGTRRQRTGKSLIGIIYAINNCV